MNLIAYDGQIELEEDDWLEEEEDIDDDDIWGCEFGLECLNPHPYHMRDECYTVEMAEEWMKNN